MAKVLDTVLQSRMQTSQKVKLTLYENRLEPTSRKYSPAIKNYFRKQLLAPDFAGPYTKSKFTTSNSSRLEIHVLI